MTCVPIRFVALDRFWPRSTASSVWVNLSVAPTAANFANLRDQLVIFQWVERVLVLEFGNHQFKEIVQVQIVDRIVTAEGLLPRIGGIGPGVNIG